MVSSPAGEDPEWVLENEDVIESMNEEVVVVPVRNFMTSIRSNSARFSSRELSRRGMDRDRLRTRGTDDEDARLDLLRDFRSARRGSVLLVPESGSVWTVSSRLQLLPVDWFCLSSFLPGKYDSSSRLNPPSSFLGWVILDWASRVLTFLFNSESELCRTMGYFSLTLSVSTRWVVVGSVLLSSTI